MADAEINGKSDDYAKDNKSLMEFHKITTLHF